MLCHYPNEPTMLLMIELALAWKFVPFSSVQKQFSITQNSKQGTLISQKSSFLCYVEMPQVIKENIPKSLFNLFWFGKYVVQSLNISSFTILQPSENKNEVNFTYTQESFFTRSCLRRGRPRILFSKQIKPRSSCDTFLPLQYCSQYNPSASGPSAYYSKWNKEQFNP